jgi:superfamily II DNA or RNA helicase
VAGGQANNAAPGGFAVGSWAFSQEHGEAVRVLENQTVWNHMTCLVWLPSRNTVAWVAADSLGAVDQPKACGLDRIAYTAAAARIAEALTQNVLLAPLEAGVIPLPHQIMALSRAVSGQRVRYLLADEVGLGKTIEAGLIIRELKLRGLVKRVLVVVPTGLVPQWLQEMRTHFSEEFQLLSPGDFGAYRRLAGDDNIWRRFDQVICPLDSVKPLERRRGWARERIEQHNQERIGDLLAAGWDIIVIDESHKVGGSDETVARYKLGRDLSQAAPFLLLLSATPHQGKTEAFHRLMSLLDRDAFPDVGSIRRENVAPFVIRTEKRRAINDRGEPLFQPRVTKLIPVTWQERHGLQKKLYEAVTEYVRQGYNQARRENRQYIGFLMLLMQRLVTSSTRAIATALQKRQAVLAATTFDQSEDEAADSSWYEQDGQEQLDELLAAQMAGLKNEREEVKLLLETARRCQAQGPDARAEALLDVLYRTQQEENDPDLKFLIFTEFVPTQEMLREFLVQHGFSVACLNGSMDLDARQRVQHEFAKDARVLVSTDAGGEGLNLQFAHVVFNYDLPWNPMKIEQRIGRVDRIGQSHAVRAFNLIFGDSVELRVHEVLEEKLKTIYDEFGVDKTSDVLDSAESGAVFERLYAQAVMNPGAIERNVDDLIREVRAKAEAERAGKSLYDSPVLDPTVASQVSNHPLPYWVERMTTAYLRSEGGKVQRGLFGYDSLEWPDGYLLERVAFVGREAQDRGMEHVSLENDRLRALIEHLPRAVPGQPVVRIGLAGLPAEVKGFWSLWQIALNTDDNRKSRVLSLFAHDDGRILLPTARLIWDKLVQGDSGVKTLGTVDGPAAEGLFKQLRGIAETQGQPLFQDLNMRHQEFIRQEREKGRYAFRVRRDALNRIGLTEVRQFRLKKLDEEERSWQGALLRQERVTPELQPVVILRVEADNG